MKIKYYQIGFETGQDIANENILDLALMEKEDFISAMLEHESEVYRQFTPFEFFAKEINDSKDPDKKWGEYEQGVYDGVLFTVQEFEKEQDRELYE